MGDFTEVSGSFSNKFGRSNLRSILELFGLALGALFAFFGAFLGLLGAAQQSLIPPKLFKEMCVSTFVHAPLFRRIPSGHMFGPQRKQSGNVQKNQRVSSSARNLPKITSCRQCHRRQQLLCLHVRERSLPRRLVSSCKCDHRICWRLVELGLSVGDWLINTA